MEDMPALSRKMTMLRYMDVRLYAMVLCLILGLTAALSGFYWRGRLRKITRRSWPPRFF